MKILITISILFLSQSVFGYLPSVNEPGLVRVIIPQPKHNKASHYTIKLSKKSDEGCNSNSYFKADYKSVVYAGWSAYYIINNIKGPFYRFDEARGCDYKGVDREYNVRIRPVERYSGSETQIFFIPEGTKLTYTEWIATEPLEAIEK